MCAIIAAKHWTDVASPDLRRASPLKILGPVFGKQKQAREGLSQVSEKASYLHREHFELIAATLPSIWPPVFLISLSIFS